MTDEICCALADGPDGEEFMRLLDNFGLWCRFSGYIGYHSAGSSSQSYVLADETGLELDRHMVIIREQHQLGFWLFRQYYICEKDTHEIALLMQRYGRRKRDVALEHTTIKTVDKLLSSLRSIIYDLIESSQEEHNEGVCL